MKKNLFLPTVVLSLILISCNNNFLDSEKGIAIYLLKDYERIESSMHQINENSVVLDDTPFIKDEEFLSYDSTECIFYVSESALDKVKNKKFPVYGTAFALTVDKEIVYTGYFWPIYSSAMCNWNVIVPYFNDDNYNGLKVQLGYPHGEIEGREFPDRRNDVRIINVLKNRK